MVLLYEILKIIIVITHSILENLNLLMKLEELTNLRKNTTYNFEDIGNRDNLFSVFIFIDKKMFIILVILEERR